MNKMEILRNKLLEADIIEDTGSGFWEMLGVEDILPTSTYISKIGAEMLSTKHKYDRDLQDLVQIIKKSSYIGGLEIDQSADISLILNYVKQIESIKIYIKDRFILKIRKLGRSKAGGLYYRDNNIIAIDINNLSSFIHELTHMIDYQNGLSERDREKLIARFKPRVTLSEWQNNKKNYYFKDLEILARLGELAYLYELEDTEKIYYSSINILISKQYCYSSGVYFHQNDFTKKDREYIKKYFRRFFRTSRNLRLSKTHIEFTKPSLIKYKDDYYQYQTGNMNIYSLLNRFNIDKVIDFNIEKNIIEPHILIDNLILNINAVGRHNNSVTPYEWINRMLDMRTVLMAAVEYAKSKNEIETVLSTVHRIDEYRFNIEKESKSKFWEEVKSKLPQKDYNDNRFDNLKEYLIQDLKSFKSQYRKNNTLLIEDSKEVA